MNVIRIRKLNKMPRYIDAEKLVEEKSWDVPFKTEDASYVQVVDVGDILDAPTADVIEVKHGTWLMYSTTMMECSSCKRHTARHKFKYCPHCGAMMEDKYND
jgi:hypothetical protein